MKENRKYTHILWDFNGTILDDVQIGIDSVNVLLRQRGLRPLDTVAAYREVFGFPVKEYYRRLGFDFDREPYEVVAPLWVAEYNSRRHLAPLTAGVRSVMAEARRLGLRQEVLSASESHMLAQQLEELGLTEYLDGWYGTGTIHAISKEDIALEWREAHPEAVVLLIGDTTHDARVAEVIGADCLLFEGGHMPRGRLEGCGVPIIGRMEEILPYIRPTDDNG